MCWWARSRGPTYCSPSRTASPFRAEPPRPRRARSSAAACAAVFVLLRRFLGELRPSHLARRAALEQCLSEQRLGRVAGVRLDPAEGRFERACAPEFLAVRVRDLPGRERPAVVPIANDAGDAGYAHPPEVWLSLFNAAFHSALPHGPSLQNRNPVNLGFVFLVPTVGYACQDAP